MKRVTIGLLVMLMSSGVLAGGWATSDKSAKITYINVEGGWVRVFFQANDKADPDSCGKTGVVTFTDDNSNRDKQYATLLTAFATGKPVQFWVNGCLDGWGSKWPQLHAVNMY